MRTPTSSARRSYGLPEGHELGELIIGQLGDPSLAGPDDRLCQVTFLLQQLRDAVLQGALGDEPVHLDRFVLPDPVGAVGGLVLPRRSRCSCRMVASCVNWVNTSTDSPEATMMSSSSSNAASFPDRPA